MEKFIPRIVELNELVLAAKLMPAQYMDLIDKIYTEEMYETEMTTQKDEKIYFLVQELYDDLDHSVIGEKDSVANVDRERFLSAINKFTDSLKALNEGG